jgi:predicted enzyme related to lactoylglutathione lyase
VTVEVDDLGAVLERVAELGGRVVMDHVTIPSVGELAFLTDPSGNLVGVIEYLHA